MLTFNLLALSLLPLLSALPVEVLEDRDVCSAGPTDYTLSNVFTFTPTGTNTHPPVVAFYYESNDGVSTDCTNNGPFTPGVRVPCANPAVSFIPNGTLFTIFETYTPCNSTKKVTLRSTTGGGFHCFPLNVPFGEGNRCEPPWIYVGGIFETKPVTI